MNTKQEEQPARVCTRCVLPETFPGIVFNEDGICNFCLEHEKTRQERDLKQEYRQRFESLINEYKSSGTYDVLMCYSGGKDSTQTLAILTEYYKLNALAVSIDNGFVSEQAFKNIRNVVENLGVDHIFFKPRFDLMSNAFGHCALSNIFSAKTLERASVICTTCMGIVKYSTLRLALEKNIPLVAYGWSPGQAPVTSSIIKNTPQMVKMMQNAIYAPLFQILGSDINPYFLQDEHFTGNYRFPHYVHPLAFLEYSEDAIFKNISRLGWEPPLDVDANSTNCLLNSYGNAVHKFHFGFHPYSYEMANMVRSGYIEREVALERLNEQEDMGALLRIAKRLSLSDAVLKK